MKLDPRPSWERYFMQIAKDVSERGTCLSAKGGCIIVKDKRIISTGYIGAPRKSKDCLERGSCLRRELKIPSGHRYEICRSVHAEQNAIINAARAGVDILGSDMYLHMRKYGQELVNALPCFICKKMVINAGIKNFYCIMKDGRIKRFSVKKWAEEWSKKDMVDDKELYDAKY